MGASGAQALTGGFQCYELIKRLYEKHSGPLLASSRIVDFGCGWGRVIRYFLKDVEPDNLVGIDKNQRAIALCVSTNSWCRFERCDALPPTGLEADSFDLLYAWSVFSHLPEEIHLRWLEEFARLLRPGGIAFITTFSRDVLERSSEWSGAPQAWQRRASEIFAPAEDWLAAYDRGEFCHAAMPEFSANFGLTCVPEDYVRRVWTKHFDVCEFDPHQTGHQSVIVCRKRKTGVRSRPRE